MRPYSPRRASKRWLNGDCPRGVLAIFDHPDSFDRYTVFYVEVIRDERDVWLGYRAMSEQPCAPFGFGIYNEMKAHEVANFRYRQHHHSAKWSDLPDAVKDLVRRDLAELEG